MIKLLEVGDIKGLPPELTGLEIPEQTADDRSFTLGHPQMPGVGQRITFHKNGAISGDRGTLDGVMQKWKEAGSGKISVLGLGGTEWRLFRNSSKNRKLYESDDWFLTDVTP